MDSKITKIFLKRNKVKVGKGVFFVFHNGFFVIRKSTS